MSRRLLLVGCGHAHLFVLESLARTPLPGTDVTLVSECDEYFYSGMIPGVIAGVYRPEQARFRPPRLAATAGVHWVRARVTAIDGDRRAAILDDGRELDFDLVSLDIGSRMRGDDLPGVRENALPVKPMRRALELVPRAVQIARRAKNGRARIVIVGAGAAGVEIAFCLHAALARRGLDRGAEILIVGASDHIVPEHGPAFRARAEALLRARGVATLTGIEVEGCEAGQVQLGGGTSIRAELIVWATGPRAPSLIRRSSLDADDAGYLIVEPTLRSPATPFVFGAGDCVSIVGHPWIARAGVYAVREGPVLSHNLRATLDGGSPKRYDPQRHWLSIMNLGEGSALLHYRGFSTHGRLVWRLKDRIDLDFMRRFQQLQSDHPPDT